MATIKTTLIKSIILFSLIFIVSSCEDKEEIQEDNSLDYQAAIDDLSKREFRSGDTIEIHGKNFGSERGLRTVFFAETAAEDDDYLVWSDTLIKVIVPNISGEIRVGGVYLNIKLSNSKAFTNEQPLIVNIILWFIKISLFITVIFIYLQVNKIWKRKHEQEVADSQSLTGLFIYILNCILWIVYYIVIVDDPLSMLDTSVYVLQGSVLFVIGTGIFVKGQRVFGIWQLIKRSLRLERKEADYLIKRWFKPANADSILSMLHQLAMIDNELDPKEQELLESFAKEWNLEYNVDKLNKDRGADKSHNYIRLRSSLKDYLDIDPPHEQVSQLRDMMNAIIHADEVVTEEEELINSELMGIISNFLEKEGPGEYYNVLVVPQKPEHEEKIRQLMPDSEKHNISGGEAFLVGTYYSLTYAEMICRQYQELNIFTVVLTPDEAREAKRLEGLNHQ